MKNLFAETIEAMRRKQVQEWALAKANYENLEGVETKGIKLGNSSFIIQFNPKRILSSAAKVDSKSIMERKCFLCKENLPVEQIGNDFVGRYIVLVNPYPIFPKHLTIPGYVHEPQKILGKLTDMLELARNLDDYVVFYNGPKCGASAPDHFHFQAGNKGFLPLETGFSLLKKKVFVEEEGIAVSLLAEYPCPALAIESRNIKLIEEYFLEIYNLLEIKEDEYEPMMNIVAWYGEEGFKLCIFPRAKHRPSCYFAEGEKNILISPASVDMGGVFITPRQADFENITATDLGNIIQEVCMDANSLEKIAYHLKNKKAQ
ncbi:MAG: hypothetical protein H6Q14_2452 [Bacteroidetes bacterium]|nr:hypothetical protein [Bacteroidota bacterium]